jgi:UDP-N-acetylglucosamine transferase subunit ALG13
MEESLCMYTTDMTEEMTGTRTVICKIPIGNNETYNVAGLWFFEFETEEEALQRIKDNEMVNMFNTKFFNR